MFTNLHFPSTAYQMLSATIHFFGVSVLSHCISRRAGAEDLSSFNTIRSIPWPRLCIILIFVDSWLFLFTSGIVIFGVGVQLNKNICSSAIYICIGFYATSKVLIYAYLIEKVHVVWSPSSGVKRFKSPMYIICIITLSLYTVVLALMTLVGNTHHIRDDGACVIGLKPIASIPLLSYDFFINICLTFLFLWPLFSSKRVLNPTVRRVAVRTLCAASVALTTSFANVLILKLLHGRELAWVCLGSCGSDVIINALAIFWVTGFGSASPGTQHPSRMPSERVYQSKTDARLNRVTKFYVGGDITKDHISIDIPKDPIETVPQQPSIEDETLAPGPQFSETSETHMKSRSSPKLLNFFRKHKDRRTTPSIQVMVTTEYELETQSRDCVATTPGDRDTPIRDSDD